MANAASNHTLNGDLTGRLLKTVSRSFYLSLRVLPGGMREPVSLAYLLARLTDTVADSSDISAERRVHWLRELSGAIAGHDVAQPAFDCLPLVTEIEPGIEHEGELELIRRSGQCLARLAALPERDRFEIARVLDDIVRGQSWDVKWFAQGIAADNNGESSDLRMRCAASADALHDYTYAVAGSVGRFWTRMCGLHAPGWHIDSVSAETMVEHGEQLGRGLQLINILRDGPKDLKLGRCYLPLATAAADHSLQGDFDTLSQRVREESVAWLDVCQDKLRHGGAYVEAVRHRRLRLAAALPWLLAEHTLDRLRRADLATWRNGVKLSRREVKSLLHRTAWRVLWGRPLDPLRPNEERRPFVCADIICHGYDK